MFALDGTNISSARDCQSSLRTLWAKETHQRKTVFTWFSSVGLVLGNSYLIVRIMPTDSLLTATVWGKENCFGVYSIYTSQERILSLSLPRYKVAEECEGMPSVINGVEPPTRRRDRDIDQVSVVNVAEIVIAQGSGTSYDRG